MKRQSKLMLSTQWNPQATLKHSVIAGVKSPYQHFSLTRRPEDRSVTSYDITLQRS